MRALADYLLVDPDEFRALLNSKITHYNEAIDRLMEDKPVVDHSAFGEGFAERAALFAASVERVHDQTVERLRARVAQFEEMLRLIDDVDSADYETAAGLNRHV